MSSNDYSYNSKIYLLLWSINKFCVIHHASHAWEIQTPTCHHPSSLLNNKHMLAKRNVFCACSISTMAACISLVFCSPHWIVLFSCSQPTTPVRWTQILFRTTPRLQTTFLSRFLMSVKMSIPLTMTGHRDCVYRTRLADIGSFTCFRVNYN